jgi:hypothetical protein
MFGDIKSLGYPNKGVILSNHLKFVGTNKSILTRMIYRGVANAGKGPVTQPNRYPTERHFYQRPPQVDQTVARLYDVATAP